MNCSALNIAFSGMIIFCLLLMAVASILVVVLLLMTVIVDLKDKYGTQKER